MSVGTGVSALASVMPAAIFMLNVPAYVAVCPGGVFDSVPQKVVRPYSQVALRETPRGMETFSRLNFAVEMRLHIYSDYQGTKQLDDIVARAAALLHHAAVPDMEGWVGIQVDYDGCFDTPDLEIDGKVVKHRVAIFPWMVAQS